MSINVPAPDGATRTLNQSIAVEKKRTPSANRLNLTETEASEIYGPSVHWFRRARWKGDGPRFIKLAGAVLYPVTELNAYFNARLVKSTSEATVKGA